MKCPKCQFDNREGAKFCEECGAELGRKCPRCSAEVGLRAKFCADCGYELAAPPVVPPSPSPASYTSAELEALLPTTAFEEWRIQPGLVWVFVWARKSSP